MKNKDDFLKKVVITIGVFLLCFTIAVFIVFFATGGSEPSTLIACVFTACLGECSICGLLKKNKQEKDKEINYKNVESLNEDEDDTNICG